MARKSRTNQLAVWMNGELAGHWSVTPSGHVFAYEDSWVRSEVEEFCRSRFLSCLATRPIVVMLFRTTSRTFSPDRPEIRNRLRDRFRAASTQAFDLLAEVGRDCVGALQLLLEGQPPENLRSILGKPLSDQSVERALAVAGGLTAIGDDLGDFRLSLAGAQEKSAFLWKDYGWQRPLGATPSTHIFKLPLGTIGGLPGLSEGSLENEWFCSRVLEAYGLPVAQSTLSRFGDQRVLIVKRFDRKLSSDRTWWLRLPVEDLCQAQGLSPPEKKYESDGWAGIGAVMGILNGSEDRATDRANFFKTQPVFWLLAAPDGHAKNFSLFLGPGVCQIPVQKLKMAMAVRGKNPHYHWNQIHRQHWDAEAKRQGLGSTAGPIIDEILDRTPEVIQTVREAMPLDFPEAVTTAVLNGIEAAGERLGAMSGT